MGVFSSVLTGSLQGIAERPLPCNYNVIQPLSAFTAVTRVQIPSGTPKPFHRLATNSQFFRRHKKAQL